MNLTTIMGELYHISDSDMSWSESNRNFQLDVWNFVLEDLLGNLTAFMDSRIRSHLIVEDSSGYNLLIHAARHQRAELVLFLIDRGVLINHKKCVPVLSNPGTRIWEPRAFRGWCCSSCKFSGVYHANPTVHHSIFECVLVPFECVPFMLFYYCDINPKMLIYQWKLKANQW